MIYTIKNNYLSVDVNSKGAELWSIKKDGTEYLWQGNAEFWANRATTLFPYVARLNQEKCIVDGKEYSMQIHGFAKLYDFSVKTQKEDLIELEITSNEETLKAYPFEFAFRITFSLEKNSLVTKYEVENNGTKTMYFGVGGHTGFNVPLEDGLDFTDYELEFVKKHEPIIVGVSDDTKLITGKDTKANFGQVLKLRHDLFDHDAILMKNMSDEVILKSEKGEKSIKFHYPSMKYLAIWHKPLTKAPYVCIEPWSSTPSREDRIEDLAKQENLISLESNKTYENIWTITIN